jgi:predicted nucleic-acid-binding protein
MSKAFVDTSVILRLLVRDDDVKIKAVERLIRNAEREGGVLYVLPVAILEVVWVLEKVYKFDRSSIRELVIAILNTPQLRIEREDVFRKALLVYEIKNVKFADAVMGYWGLERGYETVFTYDEKDFKRIEGLKVKKP